MTTSSAAAESPDRRNQGHAPERGTSPDIEGRSRWTGRRLLLLLFLFALYLSVRVVAFEHADRLEDNDSGGYAITVAEMVTEGPAHVWDLLDPDASPLYLYFAGLFADDRSSAVAAGRLASLVSSAVLFWVLAVAGLRLIGFWPATIGLLLLTLNPYLVQFSSAMLTEPTYLALVYLGLALLVVFRWGTWWSGAAVGVVFGLAFLTRFEGILFLGAVPLFLVGWRLLGGQKRPDWRTVAGWGAVFVLTFSAVASIQVVRVSRDMGRFALNGRQTWSALMQSDDGRSYQEKSYGLDHSDTQVNIRYLQTHPDAAAEAAIEVDPFDYLRLAVYNWQDFYERRLGILLGPAVLAFALVGVLSLLAARRFFLLAAVGAFLALAMTGPLLHNVVFRHVAIVMPALLLLAGLGVVDAVIRAGVIFRLERRHLLAGFLVVASVVALMDAPSLRASLAGLGDEWTNRRYEPDDYLEPARQIRETSPGIPLIVARKTYMAAHAEARNIMLPFADFDALVRYCREHDADFLVLEYRFIEDEYPFISRFEGGSPGYPFELVYRAEEATGAPLEVYRIAR